jgi:phosphate transport system protein
MGSIVETMVNTAIKALIDNDSAILKTLRENEEKINRMEVDIDEYCLKLIALHQPAASDLRFLLGIIKINAELERIADHAENISKSVLKVLEWGKLKPFVDMPKMVEIVSIMFRESLHAFVNMDVDKAKSILYRDDQVDQFRYKIIDELKHLMMEDSEKVNPAVSLILIANNFEKIADHATNIAEVVIFVAQGKDVRHHFEDPLV